LVYAPLGRDGEVIQQILSAAGVSSEVYAVSHTLFAALEEGAAALVLTEETLTQQTRDRLLARLASQAPWSDLPVILLLSAGTGELSPAHNIYRLLPGHNVTMLRRPVHAWTLVSVVEASLRARRRQYEVRDYLRQREQHAEELEKRVAERTAELTYANGILAEQIEVREKAQRQLEQLNRIVSAVSASLETGEVKETLALLLRDEVGVAAGAVLAYDALYDRLLLRESWGLSAAVRDDLASLPVPGSIFESCIARAESVEHGHFDRTEWETPWLAEMVGCGWRHWLCVPLLAQAQTQGVLLVLSEEPTMSEDQRRFFVTVGQQAGVAIANARLYAEVLARGKRLQLLAQQIISIQERERHRVSRELHDEAGQALTALLFSLAMLKDTIQENPEEAARNIDVAVQLTGDTMEQIRALAHAMRTPSLDVIGLDATLAGLCREFSRRTGLNISYAGTELQGLPEMVSISLYRVAQEGLTNVARHANASNVAMSLALENGSVVLTIADDGAGFEAAGVLRRPVEGIGLSGLNERMETLGGRLEIESREGQGTLLRAIVPIDDEASSQSEPETWVAEGGDS
jgi:signal transduction histidine kinase/FixJ family two-component response regulator